jgi:hypothetical protein
MHGHPEECATTIHCVHRFCSECIEKQLRLSRIKAMDGSVDTSLKRLPK